MEFRIVRGELPFPVWQLGDAVKRFIKDIKVRDDQEGFYVQTCGSLLAGLEGKGDLWIATDRGELRGYLLANVTLDIDNSKTYWLSQAWVHPAIRSRKEVKSWWQEVRQKAKDLECKHIVVVSARGTEAYCRWLGKGWHEYARLLKEDI